MSKVLFIAAFALLSLADTAVGAYLGSKITASASVSSSWTSEDLETGEFCNQSVSGVSGSLSCYVGGDAHVDYYLSPTSGYVTGGGFGGYGFFGEDYEITWTSASAEFEMILTGTYVATGGVGTGMFIVGDVYGFGTLNGGAGATMTIDGVTNHSETFDGSSHSYNFRISDPFPITFGIPFSLTLTMSGDYYGDGDPGGFSADYYFGYLREPDGTPTPYSVALTTPESSTLWTAALGLGLLLLTRISRRQPAPRA